MKFLDALKQLRRLGPEQRKVLETRTLFGKRRISRWLRLINSLARFDARRDAAEKPLKRGLVICIVVLVVGNLSLLFRENLSGMALPVILMNAPIVALTLWLYRCHRLLKANDLPNHLRSVVYPLLKVLAEETSLGNKVDLTVRLRGVTHPKNRVLGPKTSGQRSRKVTETLYQEDWLLMDLQLADQTDFSLRISEHLRHRKTVKRNPRGKYKTKHKYKVATKIRASFRPPGEKAWIQIGDLLLSDNPDAPLQLRDVLKIISEYYRRRQSGSPLSLA